MEKIFKLRGGIGMKIKTKGYIDWKKRLIFVLIIFIIILSIKNYYLSMAIQDCVNLGERMLDLLIEKGVCNK